ncbi:MAG: 4Fe-4S binding protein [Marinilabiliaceae bacterium]|jgi:polyferredoxin|nr:4Fe-4S binding protein [Marinilabiliaceae bacterium]
MKKLFSLNFLSRVIFLLLTPVFFQLFAIGFIWHSIYWGVITMVVIIWLFFILISPLVGRIGCGWFCFMGTTMDMASQHSIIKNKWRRPKIWVRLLILLPFLASSLTFYFINKSQGLTQAFSFQPLFLKPEFDRHYALVWTIDIAAAVIMGLLLERRWACKNLCFMGALCSAGAHYSRLIPLVDTEKCNLCGICEKNCLTRVPITSYVKNNAGMVTNSECILCGKCIDDCKQNAISIRFVWNRRRYRIRHEQD